MCEIEDEIFKQNNVENIPFIICKELSKGGYIATASLNKVFIWVKNNENKGYLNIKQFFS